MIISMSLLLGQLLKASGVDLMPHKVHLATHPTKAKHPYRVLTQGGVQAFELWQSEQTKRNFTQPQVLALIEWAGHEDLWVFGGVYDVLSQKPEVRGGNYFYATRLVGGQDHLIGRAIVHYRRTSRGSYLHGENLDELLVVDRILPESVAGGFEPFPGFPKVRLDWPSFDELFAKCPQDWVAPLSSVFGIYSIVDGTGRIYVGKADGKEGIWGRWRCYHDTGGHGGNVELKHLLATKPEAMRSFRYSILQVADTSLEPAAIDEMETAWKEKLRSREFGYNAN